MQYTVRQVVDHLLTYLTPDERVIPPVTGKESQGRAQSALFALNGAMQELYALSEDWLSTQSQGERLNAPASITATVTEGSRAATLSTSETWMEGCTIRITGDPNDNEILELDGTAATLRNPCAVAGDIAATVYHDCLTLPSNVRELQGQVFIPGVGEVRPANGEKDLRSKAYGHTSLNDSDYAFVPSGTEGLVFSGIQPVGNPRYFWLDSAHSATAAPRLRMKLMPMPSAAMLVEYRAEVNPPSFSLTDVFLHAYQEDLVPYLGGDDDTYFSGNLMIVSVPAGFPSILAGQSVELSDFDHAYVPDGTYLIYRDGPTAGTGERREIYVTLPTSQTATVDSGDLDDPRISVPDNAVDPNILIPAPHDFTESVIIPIAAQRFKSSPFFRNDSATAEISRQHQMAMEIMKATKPQPRKGAFIQPPY